MTTTDPIDTSQQADPQPANQPQQPDQGQANQPGQGPDGGREPQGGPDWQRAAEGYRQQRDEERERAATLQRQLDDLNAKGDIDALRRQLEEERNRASEAASKAERDRVNIGRLAKEGCIDIDVALPLLDENGDVDALMAAKPYLFVTASAGSTGLRPSGPASKGLSAIDRAMGLEPKK